MKFQKFRRTCKKITRENKSKFLLYTSNIYIVVIIDKQNKI